MDSLKIGELFAKLKPRFIDLITIVGGGAGPFAPTPHDLNSAHHTGTIADAQATQFLKTDGSRLLIGNQAVADGITVDGVDISAHAANISAHHEPVTILDSESIDFGLSGQQVTGSVKPGDGLIINISGVSVGQGAGITVNPDDVALTTPGTLDVSSVNMSAGNHTHAVNTSSNPGAAAQILASNASGYLQLVRLGIGISPSYPLHVSGAARIDGDLTFVGAQSIHTTADILTLSPAADLNLSPGGTARVRATSGVRLQSDNYVSQTTGWGISYAGGGDFRYLYADELHAKAFIADLEQALAGGQIISKSVAPLAEDFTVPAPAASSPLVVESFIGFDTFKVFVDGDLIRLRQFDRTGSFLSVTDCWGTVVWVSTDTVNKTQTYTFTRSASPNGGAAVTGSIINAGTLALDYGVSGNGYLESNAIDGAMAENAPYHQVVTWTTHPNDTLIVRTRLGNLKGIFNIADEFGLYAGAGVTDSDQYLRISTEAVEAHNLPIKMYDGASVTLQMTPTIPAIQMGSTLPTYDNGTGLFSGKDGSYYKFFLGSSAGNKLLWDGSNLKIIGSAIIGNGVGFTTDALLYLPFDGPRPFKTDFQVNTNGHLGQQATISGGVIGRPGKFGKAVQVAEATTNLIVNPIFENNVTDGWIVGSSDGSIERVQDSKYSLYGNYSIRLDNKTAGWAFIREADTVTLADGEKITGSAHIKREDAGVIWGLRIYEGSTILVSAVALSKVNEWEHTFLSYTNNSGSSKEVHLRVVYGSGSGNVWVDGVQFEKKDHPTPFCAGYLGDGHSWSGTAHASTSSRTLARLTYNVYPSTIKDAGSISFWFSPSLDLDGTYTITDYPDILRLRFADNEDDGSIFARYSTDGYLRIFMRSTSGVISTSDYAINAYDWVHIVAVWDGADAKIFINGILKANTSSFGGFAYGTLNTAELILNQASTIGGFIDDLAILDRALTADEVKAIYESNAPLNVTTNKFELMLTGAGKGKVWGHAGGLFAKDADGHESFALFNESISAWGNDTDIGSGDMILGRVAPGYANMKWDASTGKLLFRGDTTPQVEIGTDGALYAGGGEVWLDDDGISIGSGNNIVRLSPTDATYRLWIGNAVAASAPFSVTKAGVIYARAINISTAIVERSSAQSIPTGTSTTITYNSQVYVNPSSMHSTTTNPSRLIAPIKGVYKIESTGYFARTSIGGTYRSLAILNQIGTALDGDYRAADANASVFVKVMATIVMDVDDYVYSAVYQDTGLNLDFTPYYFSLTLMRILE